MAFSLVGLLVWAALGAIAGVLLGRFVRGSGRVGLDAVLGAVGAEVAALVLALVLRADGSVDAVVAIVVAVVGAGLFVMVLGPIVGRGRRAESVPTVQAEPSP